MTYSTRVYTGEADKQAMIELVYAHPAGNLRVVDLPYRLSSWALDDPQNARLWFDAAGRLAAWAWKGSMWRPTTITAQPWGCTRRWAFKPSRMCVYRKDHEFSGE